MIGNKLSPFWRVRTAPYVPAIHHGEGHIAITHRNLLLITSTILLSLALAACGASAEPPVPTRAPAPTFTPTPLTEPTPVDPAAAATANAMEAAQDVPAANEQQTENADTPQEPAAGEQRPANEQEEPAPTDTPTLEPLPTIEPPVVVIATTMNVRGGPGTNYAVIGSAQQGQTFPVRGKNPEGTWWQIDFQGRDGWVFGDLVNDQNTEAVAVASNIPAPPPTPIPVPPTNTPVPAEQPPPQEQPPAPTTNFEFNRAVLQRCAPNEGVTYVEGTTYKNGQPVNGYQVAFSYAPDGPIVAQIQSGPHAGYPGWRTGFYSHIVGFDGPREGDWYFWVVDGSGNRISAIAHVHTDGSAGDGKCQQAVIDFDS